MGIPLDKVLHPYDQKRVVDSIAAAERLSAGEICVHVEGKCPGNDPVKRATALLSKLGVTRTRERNGVLVYAAVRDRRFAVVGDVGIGEEANSPFWEEALQRMTVAFRRGAFGDGICGAVKSVGFQLSKRFPRQPDDKNEVSNEITTDESTFR
jgi:uncharacterized membrane protein